jgi:hypothetical protein
MRTPALVCALLLAPGCYAFKEFDVAGPSKVAELPPPPPDAIGLSNRPYSGKPAYLASARPMLPTTSQAQAAQPPEPECAQRSQKCDDRLRAVLASVDGQILALTVPPSELQLKTLAMQLDQLKPLLAPYPDMLAEWDELATLAGKMPTLTEIDQASTKRRMTELGDLLRVQLAAAH